MKRKKLSELHGEQCSEFNDGFEVQIMLTRAPSIAEKKLLRKLKGFQTGVTAVNAFSVSIAPRGFAKEFKMHSVTLKAF